MYIFRHLFAALPLRWRRGLLFFRAHKRFPPRVPVTFNEKVNWRVTYDRRPILRVGGDKLVMKAYAASKSSQVRIPKVLWSGESLAEVAEHDLGPDWVLKPISGSGSVFFGSGRPGEAGIPRSFSSIPSPDPSKVIGEWIYSTGRPGFLIEEKIPTASGLPPADLKFYVFDGEVKAILMSSPTGAGSRRRYYTDDWRPLEIRRGGHELDEVRPRPRSLSRLLDVAVELGTGFDFMRVDLYEVEGEVWFGEMSPYPASGLQSFDDPSFDSALGSYWQLPDLD